MALPDDAQAVWDRLAPDLITKRVLTAWDVDAFSAFCRATALYNRAAAEVAQSGYTAPGSTKENTVVAPAVRVMTMAAADMRSFGQRFGLTPGDRAQLKVDHNVGPKAGAARLLT